MQAVLHDVGMLPGFKLGIVLLISGDAGLQHTARSEHAAHRIRAPLVEHGCAKSGPINSRGQMLCGKHEILLK